MPIVLDILKEAARLFGDVTVTDDKPIRPNAIIIGDSDLSKARDDQLPLLNIIDTGSEEVVVQEDADGNLLFQVMLIIRGGAAGIDQGRVNEELYKLDQTAKRIFLEEPNLHANQKQVRWMNVIDRTTIDYTNSRFIGYFTHQVRILYVATEATA